MTELYKDHLEKIAMLSPTTGTNEDGSMGKLVYLFTANTLPTVFQLNLSIILFGLDVTKIYHMAVDVFDSHDVHVLTEDIELDGKSFDQRPDKTLIKGLNTSGFNIKLKPLSIPEGDKNTYLVKVQLLDNNRDFLDEAKTFFYVKQEDSAN